MSDTSAKPSNSTHVLRLAGRIAHIFIQSKLTPLIMWALSCLGTLASYKRRARKRRIRAPFSGVVSEKKADAGTLASPGMPIFTLEDTRSFRLEVTVDESDIHLVHVGQGAPVAIDAMGDIRLPGKIVQILPAADAASHSFLVKVELPAEAHLHSGFFGRARFPRGEASALLIPRTSLVERGQLQGVYVLDANEIAGLRYVTLGRTSGEHVEVLSGLQAGEKLVAAPGDRELGGKRIAMGQ